MLLNVQHLLCLRSTGKRPSLIPFAIWTRYLNGSEFVMLCPSGHAEGGFNSDKEKTKFPRKNENLMKCTTPNKSRQVVNHCYIFEMDRICFYVASSYSFTAMFNATICVFHSCQICGSPARLYEKCEMQIAWLSSHSQLAALSRLPIYQHLIVTISV